jgi:hypothetical protein
LIALAIKDRLGVNGFSNRFHSNSAPLSYIPPRKPHRLKEWLRRS